MEPDVKFSMLLTDAARDNFYDFASLFITSLSSTGSEEVRDLLSCGVSVSLNDSLPRVLIDASPEDMRIRCESTWAVMRLRDDDGRLHYICSSMHALVVDDGIFEHWHVGQLMHIELSFT